MKTNKSQYPFEKYMADTGIPYLQGRIIYCVFTYVQPGCEARLREARALVDDIRNNPATVDALPAASDDYCDKVSSCTERFIDCRGFNGMEQQAIRIASTLHIFPKSHAPLDYLAKNLDDLRAFLASQMETSK